MPTIKVMDAKIVARTPGLAIDTVVTGRTTTPNRTLAVVSRMEQTAHHQVVLVTKV